MKIYTEDELRKAFRAGHAAGVFLADLKTDEYEQKYIDAINNSAIAKDSKIGKTPVEWLVDKYEQKYGRASSLLMKDEIREALLMEGREMVKHLGQPRLVKVYDPVDPESSIKSVILDAYNAGYEDRDCNSIKDAEQYYLNKYKPA